jgi:hypothetical protein
MRDPLTELATVPAVQLHPAVLAARSQLAVMVDELLAVADSTLDRPWRWRSMDHEDEEVRYGFYRIHERLEEAVGTIVVGRSEAPPDPIGPAIPALGAMAAARWELHGALVPLSADDWDADPGGGEWTIRQAIGHIISGQRSYGWFNAWYLGRPAIEGAATRPPEGFLPPEPTEEAEAVGSPLDVSARLDTIVDACIAANAGLDHAAMRVGAIWGGEQVTIAFRLGRYGSHIREHIVQVDKTLAMLGREPSEVERLVRLILATYGRLESQLVGRSAAELERPFGDGATAVAILAEALADATTTATRVRAAAT